VRDVVADVDAISRRRRASTATEDAPRDDGGIEIAIVAIDDACVSAACGIVREGL
jgi:hypothetical protein